VDEPLSKKCLEAALDTAEQSLGERLTQRMLAWGSDNSTLQSITAPSSIDRK